VDNPGANRRRLRKNFNPDLERFRKYRPRRLIACVFTLGAFAAVIFRGGKRGARLGRNTNPATSMASCSLSVLPCPSYMSCRKNEAAVEVSAMPAPMVTEALQHSPTNGPASATVSPAAMADSAGALNGQEAADSVIHATVGWYERRTAERHDAECFCHLTLA
jgi:hypothetical protein